MKLKIRLDTESDVIRFVGIATKIPEKVYITDGEGLKVSAKSVIGSLYAMTFETLWCECEKDIYFEIREFVEEE